MRAIGLITLFSLIFIPTLAHASGNSRVCEGNLKDSTKNRLGWIPAKNPCGGYYQNLSFPNEGESLAAFNQNPVDLSFVEATFLEEGRSMLSEVAVSQPQRLLTGDIAYLNRDKKLNRFETIDLYGHVVVQEPGKLITGDAARMSLLDRTGTFSNVLYRLSLNADFSYRPILLDTPGDPEKAL
ncbi:MAG: hypothetical protein ACNA7Y_06155, partial [Gammaproteobacteria bacterium]